MKFIFIPTSNNNYLPKNYQLLLNDKYYLYGHQLIKNINVKDKIDAFFTKNGIVTIPQKTNFNNYFTDPCYYVTKKLIIGINNYELTIPENNLLEYIILPNKNKINIIFFCTKKDYKYFQDYIENLNIITVIILYDNENDLLEYDFLNDNESILIFRYHLPFFINYSILNNIINTDKVFVLNTEQLSEPNRLNHILSIENKDVSIIDYSKSNINYLRKSLYLPYQYCKNEILELIDNNMKYEYDIAIIYGDQPDSSPRRKSIYDQLVYKNVKVISANGWGNPRDDLIRKSKILLNIHYCNEFNIFEHMRCDRWIFAKKIIISEEVNDVDLLDIKDFIIFSKYDDLINKVIDVLNKFDDYSNFINNKNINDIINSRELIKNQFLLSIK